MKISKKVLSILLTVCVLFTAVMAVPVSANQFKYGDANQDNLVNSVDATLVLQYYANIINSEQDSNFLTYSDVNGDKIINSVDVTLILQYYSNIISVFPVESSSAPEEPLQETTTLLMEDLTVTTSMPNAVSQNGSTITISEGGEYILSGEWNGTIIVNAPSDTEVILTLNRANITCNTDNPIYIASADKAIVKAQSDTTNTITDGRISTNSSTDSGGAIYSKSDLTIGGQGTLTVNSTYNNGIHTKKDLKVQKLNLSVTAPNNALKGNDSVQILSGVINLTSTNGDGVKTTNSNISSKQKQRGTISIGNQIDTTTSVDVTILALSDGIDATYDVNIYPNSTVKIGTYGVSDGADVSTLTNAAIKADNSVNISGGNLTIANINKAVSAKNTIQLETLQYGIGDVIIANATITVNNVNHAITADRNFNIDNSTITITSTQTTDIIRCQTYTNTNNTGVIKLNGNDYSVTTI